MPLPYNTNSNNTYEEVVVRILPTTAESRIDKEVVSEGVHRHCILVIDDDHHHHHHRILGGEVVAVVPDRSLPRQEEEEVVVGDSVGRVAVGVDLEADLLG